MKIRTRLLLNILPPVIALFVLGDAITYVVARNELYDREKNSLQFKAELFKNRIVSHWNLLLDYSLYTQLDFIVTAQDAITDDALSIIRYPNTENELIQSRSPELIFAVVEERNTGAHSIAMSTRSDFTPSQEELKTLMVQAEDIASNQKSFGNAQMIGVDYVFTTFRFDPFRWNVFVASEERVFAVSSIVIRWINIITTVLVTLTLVIILYILSQSFTRPLQNMAATAQSIGSQKFIPSVQFPYEHDDEIGTLALTFNALFEELNRNWHNITSYAFESATLKLQEQRIRTVFQKYVPQELVNHYVTNPTSLLEGGARKVAVIFCDVRNFSSISERMGSDKLVRFLNRFFGGVVKATTECGGVVDKFIGDCAMLLFGAPVSHSDDMLRAMKATYKILTHVKKLNQRALHDSMPAFEIGMGISWGTTTVGNLGNESKIDYTAIGKTVNLASRLEALCKHYQQTIIISEEVAHEIKERYPLRLVDKVIVKGFHTASKIYTIPKNTPAQRKKVVHPKGYDAYQEGANYYYTREFKKALTCFEKARTAGLDDYLTEQFINRSQEALNTKVSSNWDGVTRF